MEGGQLEQKFQYLGWKGLRLESADNLHIAQFNRDAFVFSRLQPYSKWEQFSAEALRLWRLHLQLTQPAEIQRLGLRFINRIMMPAKGARVEKYLQAPPKPPLELNLPFASFFHRDVLRVSGHPYVINISRTVQPPQKPAAIDEALILDIDIFTNEPFDLQEEMLEQRLAQMRWLKNKVFFGSIIKDALKAFR